MDRDNASFERTLGEIRQYLSDKVVPLYLPVGSEKNFKGVVDVLANKAYLYAGDGSKEFEEAVVPQDMADEVSKAREEAIERIVEADDELMMRYLEGDSISKEELLPVLRKAVRERKLFGVAGRCSASVGVMQLDVISDSPSPLEMPPQRDKGEAEVDVPPDRMDLYGPLLQGYGGSLCGQAFFHSFCWRSFQRQGLFSVNKETEERVSGYRLMPQGWRRGQGDHDGRCGCCA